MNIPRIELHFLPVSSCSIFGKTRQTPLLMWTWDAYFFVDMKCNTLKVYVQLCTRRVFTCCWIFVRGCGNPYKCMEKRREEQR